MALVYTRILLIVCRRAPTSSAVVAQNAARVRSYASRPSVARHRSTRPSVSSKQSLSSQKFSPLHSRQFSTEAVEAEVLEDSMASFSREVSRDVAASNAESVDNVGMAFSDRVPDAEVEHAKYVVRKILEEGLPKAQNFYYAVQKIADRVGTHAQSEELQKTVYDALNGCKKLAESSEQKLQELISLLDSHPGATASQTSTTVSSVPGTPPRGAMSRKQEADFKKRKRLLGEEIDHLNLRFRREFDRAEEAYFTLSAEYEVKSGLAAMERYSKAAERYIAKQTELSEDDAIAQKMTSLHKEIDSILRTAQKLAAGEKTIDTGKIEKPEISKTEAEKTEDAGKLVAAAEPIGPLRYLAKSKFKELRELHWRTLYAIDHPDETLRTEMENSLSRQVEARNVAYAKFSMRKQALGEKEARKLGHLDGVDLRPIPIDFDLTQEVFGQLTGSEPVRSENEKTGKVTYYAPKDALTVAQEKIAADIVFLFNNKLNASGDRTLLKPENVQVSVHGQNLFKEGKRWVPERIMNAFGIDSTKQEKEKWKAMQPQDTGDFSHWTVSVRLQLDEAREDEPYLRALLEAFTKRSGENLNKLSPDSAVLQHGTKLRFGAAEKANDIWKFAWFKPVMKPDLVPWVPEAEQRILGIDKDARLADDPIDQVDDDMFAAYWRNVGLGVTPVEPAAKVTMEVRYHVKWTQYPLSDIIMKHCRSILASRESLKTKRQRHVIRKSPHVHGDAKEHIQELFYRRLYTFVCPISQRRRIEWCANEVIANDGEVLLHWETSV